MKQYKVVYLCVNEIVFSSYTVCIRPQAGYCCIQYQVCGGEAMGMTISPTKVGGTPTAFQDDACLTADYIVIPGSGEQPCCHSALQMKFSWKILLDDSIIQGPGTNRCRGRPGRLSVQRVEPVRSSPSHGHFPMFLAASCIQTTGDSTLYSRYCGSFLSTTTAAAANSPICGEEQDSLVSPVRLASKPPNVFQTAPLLSPWTWSPTTWPMSAQ